MNVSYCKYQGSKLNIENEFLNIVLTRQDFVSVSVVLALLCSSNSSDRNPSPLPNNAFCPVLLPAIKKNKEYRLQITGESKIRENIKSSLQR